MNLALRWRNQNPSQEAVKPCINVGAPKHILSKGQGGVGNWGDEPGVWVESDQKEGSPPLGNGGARNWKPAVSSPNRALIMAAEARNHQGTDMNI